MEVALPGFLLVNKNSGFANFNNDNSCVSGFTSAISPTGAGAATPLLMDKILTEYADQAYETTRLGRNGVQTARELISAAMLAELEAIGDAMRYLNSDGQIAWKATPQLRDYLMDLQLDAEADLEEV